MTAQPGGISVVIPAFNEEAGVGPQVAAVRAVLHRHHRPHEVIVVDDGSSDATAYHAMEAGARVLRHVENRGYGASIKAGVLAAVHETIVITDADGTYPAEEIPALVDDLRTADMVVGARTGKHVHIPLVRRPAKWILGLLANQIAGQKIPDLNSGLRAFRRETIRQYFLILSNQFSFTTTSTLALMADDYRVVYRPIDYHARVGRSKIRPRMFMDFVILVLRMAMLFQPLKVFLPLAFACGLAGLAKVVYDVVMFYPRTHLPVVPSIFYEPVLSTSALLLLSVGLQLLLIGMVADGVVRRIAHQSRPLVPSSATWVQEAAPHVAETKVVVRVEI